MKSEQWLIERLNEQAAAVRAAPPKEKAMTFGVPAEDFSAQILRLLEPADLLERQTNGADTIGAEPYKLKRLRYCHHNLARLIAEGTLTQVEISAQTGYSQQTITSYKRDPAFRELVVNYEEDYSDRKVDIVSKLETLAVDVLVEIADRLETDPSSVSMAQLLECSKLLLDRSGYGPITKQLNVSATISAETLMRIKENVEAEEGRRISLAKANGALQNGREPPGSILEGEIAPAEGEVEGKAGAGATVREESGQVPAPLSASL